MILITRLFLAAVGILYLYLAVWCSLFPERTSSMVGFDLRPGTGQSEFLVIYGGLELAMAIIFLGPLVRPQFADYSLFVCLTIHACLALFRSVSLFLYPEVEPMIYQLALGEWIIFLGAVVLSVGNRHGPAPIRST